MDIMNKGKEFPVPEKLRFTQPCSHSGVSVHDVLFATKAQNAHAMQMLLG